jgi:hypothetical protein
MNQRIGFSVSIKRKDGTTFLACSAPGDLPAVFTTRKYAAVHKRELEGHGFDCRVVMVSFTDPVEMIRKADSDKPRGKDPKKVAAGYAPRGPRTQQHSRKYGLRVRASRRDLTVKEFAKKIGVPIAYVLRAEDGWLPNHNLKGTIADKLGFSGHRMDWPDVEAKVFKFEK